MKRIATWLLALAMASFPAAATTASTDYTDLWWSRPDLSENGWGVNVIQQGNIVFATFFVYGPDGTPRWYVASELGSLAAPPGQNIFTGALYTTTGTHFAMAWNPADRTFRQVGSATFTFTSPTEGTLQYSVDNVEIVKSIKRQTWRANDLAGTYVGGMTANCNGGANGQSLIFGDMSVAHGGSQNVTFVVDFTNALGQPGTCNYNGAYNQHGKLGYVTGNFSCTIENQSNAPAGTFSLLDIQAAASGFTSRFTGRDQFCEYSGFFGGVRDVI